MDPCSSPGMFWEDHAQDMLDPDYRREYIINGALVATIDAILNELDEARENVGLSKAELARIIGAEPATIRKLFTANHANPTFATLTKLASALGLKVTLAPLTPEEQKEITQPLYETEPQARERGLRDR